MGGWECALVVLTLKWQWCEVDSEKERKGKSDNVYVKLSRQWTVQKLRAESHHMCFVSCERFVSHFYSFSRFPFLSPACFFPRQIKAVFSPRLEPWRKKTEGIPDSKEFMWHMAIKRSFPTTCTCSTVLTPLFPDFLRRRCKVSKKLGSIVSSWRETFQSRYPCQLSGM